MEIEKSWWIFIIEGIGIVMGRERSSTTSNSYNNRRIYLRRKKEKGTSLARVDWVSERKSNGLLLRLQEKNICLSESLIYLFFYVLGE